MYVYVYMCVLPACMFMCQIYTVPAEAGRRSFSSFGTGVTDGLVVTMWVLRIYPSSLEEQAVLYITELVF